jgi:hypothetical protein
MDLLFERKRLQQPDDVKVPRIKANDQGTPVYLKFALPKRRSNCVRKPNCCPWR